MIRTDPVNSSPPWTTRWPMASIFFRPDPSPRRAFPGSAPCLLRGRRSGLQPPDHRHSGVGCARFLPRSARPAPSNHAAFGHLVELVLDGRTAAVDDSTFITSPPRAAHACARQTAVVATISSTLAPREVADRRRTPGGTARSLSPGHVLRQLVGDVSEFRSGKSARCPADDLARFLDLLAGHRRNDRRVGLEFAVDLQIGGPLIRAKRR